MSRDADGGFAWSAASAASYGVIDQRRSNSAAVTVACFIVRDHDKQGLHLLDAASQGQIAFARFIWFEDQSGPYQLRIAT
jgi:hypothetical protein